MLKLLIFLFLISVLFMGCTHPKKSKNYHERYYQTILCNELEGQMEFVLQDRTRVDCLTDEYAIEVDFAKKWAESIGQSLFYADMTNKKPAVALIVGEKENRLLKRLERVSKKFNIKIYIMKKED